MAGDGFTQVGKGGKKVKYHADDWMCSSCNKCNFRKFDVCHFCSKGKPKKVTTYGQTKVGKADLADRAERATKERGGGG